MAEIERIPLERRVADLKPYIEAAAGGQHAFHFSDDLDVAYLIDGLFGHHRYRPQSTSHRRETVRRAIATP